MTGPLGHPDRPLQPAGDDLVARVTEVLELIRPAVQQDGGDIELVQVTTDGTVRIRFLGACVGCPSSEITLREGIARNLRERVPEVTEVLAVN
jgi:Fe-S cluster biogenesis protein NfuA